MITKVSALKILPAKVKKGATKIANVKTHQVPNADVLIKDKLSYVQFAEKGDTIDSFASEHFNYLKYLGVRD